MIHRSTRTPSSTAALWLALALAIGADWRSTAQALDCGTSLAVAGDPETRVRDVCGEPSSAASRVETRMQGGANGWPVVWVSVRIDVWIYDFGPQRFMEELTFENGVLRQLRTLGRGTARGRARTSGGAR